jgi:microcystin-dependent protein
MSTLKQNGTRSFALPNIRGRGFAMGHDSGTVSLALTIGSASFSMDAVSNAEARALAQAIIDAADYAEATRMRRDHGIEPVSAGGLAQVAGT